MKEQNKPPEKKLNKMEITNLSDTEFKTLVIRMLKELTDDSKIIREEIKVTVNEIKKSPQGTNSGEGEARNQINNLEHRKASKLRRQRNMVK